MSSKTMAAEKCGEDLFCGINLIEDYDHMTDLQKKHLPVITAPSSVRKGEFFEVTIEIGKLMTHPNELGHYIEFIELYADHAYLARMDFTAQRTSPVMKTSVCLEHSHGKLRAFAFCNLHGMWGGQTDIEVTD